MIHEATMPSAALRWAEFSGDFNPIHFDVVQAAKAGSDRLIVHGMLSLLHVKQATLKVLRSADPAGSWSRFKAVFRRPISQSSPLQLSIRSKGEAIRFALESDGNEHSRGLHESVDAPVLPVGAAPEILLEADFVRQQHARFRESFESVSDGWIFLDALVFGQFLEARFVQLAEMPANIVAVQVSHSVTCDAGRLQALFGDIDRLPRVGYSVRKENQTAVRDSQAGVAQLDVFADGALVMQIEIGLLAKAGLSV